MKSKDDKELLILVKTSNQEAFTEVYNRFWKSLYTYALKKTGDHDETFDLVQELFIEFWDRRDSLPEMTTGLSNYLHGAVFFKLAKYFRTKGFNEKHQKNFEDFLNQQDLSEINADFLSVLENERKYEDIITTINTSIELMPPKMREIFVMSRSGQYSISEIAEQLDLSTQTVKNQISNAFARLRLSTSAHALTTAQLSMLAWLTIS